MKSNIGRDGDFTYQTSSGDKGILEEDGLLELSYKQPSKPGEVPYIDFFAQE